MWFFSSDSQFDIEAPVSASTRGFFHAKASPTHEILFIMKKYISDCADVSNQEHLLDAVCAKWKRMYRASS